MKLDYFFVICYLVFPLRRGSEVELPTHSYPMSYPSNSYVLWRLQYQASGYDDEIYYHILFGYLHLGRNDYLVVGSGLKPDNSSTVIAFFGDDFDGHPHDLLIPAEDLFVEFTADSISEKSGFRIMLMVLNISGNS